MLQALRTENKSSIPENTEWKTTHPEKRLIVENSSEITNIVDRDVKRAYGRTEIEKMTVEEKKS